MYPLGTTTFSHQKIRYPTISHQFAEVVGKKIIFSSRKPKKKLEAFGNRKKSSQWEKKHCGERDFLGCDLNIDDRRLIKSRRDLCDRPITNLDLRGLGEPSRMGVL